MEHDFFHVIDDVYQFAP